MIHSMSGGIIKDVGSYTFLRVLVDGDEYPRWFITDIDDIEENDRVKVPKDRSSAIGTVVRVERNVSGQVTPIPIRMAKKIIGKI